jgi:hypothetical protein
MGPRTMQAVTVHLAEALLQAGAFVCKQLCFQLCLLHLGSRREDLNVCHLHTSRERWRLAWTTGRHPDTAAVGSCLAMVKS